MRTLCTLVSRRSFLHGLLVSLGLCSCRLKLTANGEGFMPLREPVVIALDAAAENDGVYEFEAWLSPGGDSDKLLDGILLSNGKDLAVYSTYCPHEACVVKLERNPGQLSTVVASGAVLPEHAVLYCACHFSVYETQWPGERISGYVEPEDLRCGYGAA